MTTTGPERSPELAAAMTDAATRARQLGHTLSAFRRWPSMDGGGYTCYIADCIGDESQWCKCAGECLVTVHEDRHNINRVHAHGSALQYDHRGLLQVGYSESSAPR